MQLKQKGQQANVSTFKQLMATMTWTMGADFDLAAAYEKQDGTRGLVYFGELGDLNAFPFMQLSGDEGVGDERGDNTEQLRIASLEGMKFVWLLCWDYEKVKTGAAARFADSDVDLKVMDDTGHVYDVKLDTGEMGNVAVVAVVDNSSPMGATLKNKSKTGTLKGLTTLDELFVIIDA